MDNELHPYIKILLIEDNPGDARLISVILSEITDFHCDLTITDTLQKGLEILNTLKIDVVLLDLNLPDSHGIDTITQVHKNSKTIPIIVLTGLTDITIARKSVQMGAQDYLIKGQVGFNMLTRSIYHSIDRNKMHLKIESLFEILQESKKTYEDLFKNSPYPIIILNPNGEIIDCNSGFEKLRGSAKSDIILNNNRFSTYIDDRNHKKLENTIKMLMKGEETDSIEIFLKNKDLALKHINIKFSLVSLNENILIHGLIQDLTELKESLKEVKKLEQFLENINALIENAPLPIILLNQDLKVLRVNKRAIELLKYLDFEIINKEICDFFKSGMIEELHKHYENVLKHLKKTNRLETQIITKDNIVIDVEIISNTLEIAGNTIIQSFISNISERIILEKNRQQLLDQLIENLDYKSKFFTSMSHDLRTPLNAISGFSELLLEELYGSLNTEQKDYINDIKISSNHLLELINTVLDLSKIEVGKFNLDIKKIDIDLVLQDISDLVKPLYKKKKLVFKTINHTKSKFINIDPLRFKQILFNLIDNAIKFTEKGIIKLYCRENKDHWKFQIIDTGIGIHPKDHEVVFREFGRIEHDKVRPVSGSGIGLTLTQRLVELHGGTIWFDSKLNVGTSFYFTIPK